MYRIWLRSACNCDGSIISVSRSRRIQFEVDTSDMFWWWRILLMMWSIADCWHTDTRGSSGYHRPRGKFGDYSCDSPWPLIESAAHQMRMKQGDSVEFVLWTGWVINCIFFFVRKFNFQLLLCLFVYGPKYAINFVIIFKINYKINFMMN